MMRKFLFQLLYYPGTIIIGIIILPSLLLPQRFYIPFIRQYFALVAWLERTVMGLAYRVEGAENLPADGRYIVAAKHQSAYETLKLPLLFTQPVVIVKRELLLIPFWGWYAAKAGMIGIHRARARQALPQMIAGVKDALARGRTVVIFPQGTRVPPDVTTAEKPYKRGIFSLYKETGVPVIPLALNSGVFADRHTPTRPGVVTFRFMPPLQPGLPEDTFMTQLEETLETTSNHLARDLDDKAPPPKTPTRILNILIVTVAVAAMLYTAAWMMGAYMIGQALKDVWQNPDPQTNVRASDPPPRITGFPTQYVMSWSGKIKSPDITMTVRDARVAFRPWPGAHMTLDLTGLQATAPKLQHIPGGKVSMDAFHMTLVVPSVVPLQGIKAEIQKLHDQNVTYHMPKLIIKNLKAGPQVINVVGKSGALSFDKNLQPVGQMDLMVSGLADVTKGLTDQIKDPLARSLAGQALGSLMGQKKDQAPGTMNTTLVLRDGRIKAGPIPIYSIGRIYWPVTAPTPTAPKSRP